MSDFTQTDRTTIHRRSDRSSYDRDTILAILDEALLCHVGFTVEGQSRIISTTYGRRGNAIYFHGAQESGFMKALRHGMEACVAVTLLDGLVLARSAFNHSMNYRSVIMYGTASELTEDEEKLAGLKTIVEHVIPGRWEDTRRPSDSELYGTAVFSFPIVEVSAKIQQSPPHDNQADYQLDYWAGQIPLVLQPQPPIDDPLLKAEITAPSYVTNYRRSTS
ncbi:MAG: pyridoxamine 5'-phosphate oxidase family protein, partial [Planctomycetales bacterium]